jgi:predicted membrane-bound spermidine synthase
MVIPYAIRLKAPSLDTVGRATGSLLWVSTIASVAAAITTGFVLIPNVGICRSLFLIGLVLVVAAILGFVIQRKRKIAFVAPLVWAIAGALLFRVTPAETMNPNDSLMAVKQSEYGEIRVVDLADLRYLLLNGDTRAIIDPQTWQTRSQDVNVLDIAKGFFDQPGEMLLVGMGGASVVKSYYGSGWHVDAVEIDPVVTKIARAYFGLLRDEAKVYEMDARRFLVTHDKRYDLIVVDALGSSPVPFHLVTTEALALIRSHLVPGGVLAMNVEAVGWHNVLIRSLAATVNRQFQHVTVLPIAEPPDQFGSFVLLASNRALSLREEPPVPQDRFTPEYDRAHAWDNRFQVDTAGIPVLTDDLNPIDVWAERANLEERKRLHALFSKPGIAW